MKAIQVTSKGLDENRKLVLNAHNLDGSFVSIQEWDDKINIYMRQTAMALAKKLNYNGTWIGEMLPGGDYAFICIDPDSDLIMGIRE